MRLAEMLRLYIASMRLEQREVAAQCGISESTLTRFLNDGRLPRADAFARLVAWCCAKQQIGQQAHPDPLPDYDSRVEAIEKQISELNRRTIGMVRLR